MKVLAFHGTDYDVAQKIDHEGFISKPSLEHWLGNAIYFYIDELLAKWWTTRPSNKFGTSISWITIIISLNGTMNTRRKKKKRPIKSIWIAR